MTLFFVSVARVSFLTPPINAFPQTNKIIARKEITAPQSSPQSPGGAMLTLPSTGWKKREEKRKNPNRNCLIQSANSYFMDVNYSGC